MAGEREEAGGEGGRGSMCRGRDGGTHGLGWW